MNRVIIMEVFYFAGSYMIKIYTFIDISMINFYSLIILLSKTY